MTTALLLASSSPAVSHVLALAQSLAGEVAILVAGPRSLAEILAATAGVPVTLLDSGDAPAEALAPAVAAQVAELAPDVLLAADLPKERTLLGYAAAAAGRPVLPAVTAAGPEEITRSLYNVVELTESLTGPVALVAAGSGSVPEAGPGTLAEAAAGDVFPLAIVAEEPGDEAGADLAVAPRVVGVGRGLKAAEDIALIEGLARALGAAVACSRPVAEGLGWLPRDRYLGISGRTIEPDLYVAVGISGQMQHMMAVRGAKRIVAINSDPNAPVLAQSDVAVVGDLYAVVPALTAALS